MIGGFWIAALTRHGRKRVARAELVKLARACSLDEWAFAEWLHGRTSAPRGMEGQSWNAAAFLFAEHAVAATQALKRKVPPSSRLTRRDLHGAAAELAAQRGFSCRRVRAPAAHSRSRRCDHLSISRRVFWARVRSLLMA